MKTRAEKGKLTIAMMAAVLMGIVSCTKEQMSLNAEEKEIQTTGEGLAKVKVVEFGTGVPLANLPVRFGDETGNGITMERTAMFTDHYGELVWPLGRKVSEVCVEETPGYYAQCAPCDPEQVDGEYAMTVKLYPKAAFRLQAVDLEELNPEYFVRVELPVYNEKIGYIDLDAWEEAEVPVYGNMENVLYYSVRSVLNPDEIIASLQVSAYCEGGETLNLKVPY
ncbi:MAG: hypothetical protein JNM00_04905 [Flavobacteriales bacterium]|nr:hypothetical protein [Flavobacteriales bacterium]